jgi:ADP-ribose pyrophosphatase YjhB (NUDIX family)
MNEDNMSFIPGSIYRTVLDHLPIISLEAMIMKDGKILLLRRNNPPVQGQWWFPGGRLRKGESFEAALRREVKEETGLAIKPVKFIGVYNRVFPERHDVTLAFLCKIENKSTVVMLNDEHSEYQFFKELPSPLNPFIMEVIQDSKKVF